MLGKAGGFVLVSLSTGLQSDDNIIMILQFIFLGIHKFWTLIPFNQMSLSGTRNILMVANIERLSNENQKTKSKAITEPITA